MQEEEVTEIPLVYPLVSVTLKTTTIVDGRAVVSECEEVVNVQEGMAAKKQMSRLMREFKDYVRKVIEAAQSPQAHDALQNILDNHPPRLSTNEGDLPSLKGSIEGLDQRTLPTAPPVASPDKASL